MIWRLLADTVLVLHLCFIVFAVCGAALVLWRQRVIWLHLPAAGWAVAISFGGWICPLTPLENYLRLRGGAAGYTGSFIDHYLLPLIYPAGLTSQHQLAIGSLVLLLNLGLYTLIWRHWQRHHPAPPGSVEKRQR